MIAIVNFNTENKKFLPMISLMKDETTAKKLAKKQLMNEIIEAPQTLKAYRQISVYKVAEVDEDMNINVCEKKEIFSYKKLLEEITKELTK